MEIKRAGSQPSAKGPAERFTGTVRINPLIQAHDPARIQAASVTFEPGRPHHLAHTPARPSPLAAAGRSARAARQQTSLTAHFVDGIWKSKMAVVAIATGFPSCS